MSLDDEGDEAWDGSDETDMNQTMLPIVLVVAFRIRVPITDASKCALVASPLTVLPAVLLAVFDHVPCEGQLDNI